MSATGDGVEDTATASTVLAGLAAGGVAAGAGEAATAGGIAGEAVGRKKHTKSRKLATKLVDSDEIFARALQAEEHAAAEKIAAAVAEDERLAWSLSDSNYSPGSCACLLYTSPSPRD